MLASIARATATLCLLSALVACGSKGGREALERLQSGDARERLGALQRLEGRPDLIDMVTLRRVAGDVSPLVRTAAAKLAAERGDAASVELLAKLADDRDPGVRAAGLRGLTRHARQPAAKAHLLAAYPKLGMVEREAIAQAVIGAGGTFEEVLRHEASILWERNLQGMEAGGVAELVGALEELGRSGRPEAVERLGGLLASPSNHVSLAAARGLAASRDASARPWLEARLEGESSTHRVAAAEALGALGDPAAIPALAEAAKRQGEEGLLAARSLVQLEGAEVTACAVALDAQNPRAAGWLARRAAEGDRCTPPGLEEALRDDQRFFTAAQVAKELRLETAVAPLLEVAGDEGETTSRRLAALEALGGIGGPAAVEGLEGIFDSLAAAFVEGREKWVRAPLPHTWADGFAPGEDGVAAGDRGDVETPELVVEIGPELELLFVAAAKAATAAGSDLVPARLAPFVGDPASGVRAASVGAAQLSASSLIALASDDPSWEVRAAAVRALGAAPGAEVHSHLRELLTRPLEVRQLALEALEARGAREALARLPGDHPLEPDVAAALGRLGDPIAAKGLLQGDGDGVTPAWIASLRHVKGREASAAARRHLHHDRAEIRRVAAEVLGARCDGASRTALTALARADYHVEVRQAAQGALDALDGAGCTSR